MKHVAIDGGRAHQVTMLTQVAETTPVGIYLRDKDKMLFMNSAFLSLFGFPPDHDRAAVLRDVRSRVHPDDMEKARTTLIAADGIRSAECELRLKFPDGNDRWIHITNTPVPGAGTGVVRVVGTAQDVTARRNTEADLRESENKLVQVTDAIAVGISLREVATGTILYVNPAWAAIFKTEPHGGQQLTAEAMAQVLVHPDDRNRCCPVTGPR